jgi:hypothetical protein
MGQSWPLLLAEHLNYFTVKSLRVCAADAGLSLIAWGTRPVSFSFDYVLFRLSQHGLPTGVVSKFASAVGLEQKAIPIWMGEVYAIYRRL